MGRVTAILAVAAAILGAVAGPAEARTARTSRSARRPTTTVQSSSAPLPPPKAFIVIDADTGTVISASNDRTALPPASLTKVLTALIAVDSLPDDATVPVSARAAAAPAHKISMQEGQVWPFTDALHALLLSSANDAAVALAERSGGSLDQFPTLVAKMADRLHLADAPVVQDPAGLDDSTSVGGGNMISARDLAIVTRTALAQPTIAEAVATRVYSFTGPDGVSHRLLNHNFRFLDSYQGGIGVKTGYTSRAGQCLITAARRDGHTMLAVVMGGTGSMTPFSSQLLDTAFAAAASGEPTGDVLPPVVRDIGANRASAAATASASRGHSVVPVVHRAKAHSGLSGLATTAGEVGIAAIALGGFAVRRRRRIVLARRAARRRAAAARQASASASALGHDGPVHGYERSGRPRPSVDAVAPGRDKFGRSGARRRHPTGRRLDRSARG